MTPHNREWCGIGATCLARAAMSLKPETLLEKQQKFSLMLAALIARAYELGYELTGGDWYATDGHMDNSLHYERLAVDLNLFQGGEYLTKTTDHAQLGAFWESMGGAWGGRFDDGNHYSLAHEGRR